MSIAGFALVLTAAFCHAIWNVFVKRINGGPELIWLFSCLSVVLYLPLAIWVLLVDRPHFNAITIGLIIGSAVLHLGYFLLLQTGYRKGDLSLVYPVARATGPLLSTTFAILLLDETITLQMATGGMTIIFGVLMLTGGIKTGARPLSTSLLFGLGAGMLIGSYTAWDAYAVSIHLIPPLLLDYSSSVGRAVILAPVALRNRTRISQHWQQHKLGVLAIAVFNPLAYILVLYALSFTPVSLVAPLREVSVLLTILAGSLFLGEGNLRHRLVWAVVILFGMTLLVSA
nr:DMT family transporter [uncultured Cohaesibacter sp.]